MAIDRIASRIEALIRHADWKPAQTLIEKQLELEPDDHWLWSRLSGVQYEQRDYRAALVSAEKALVIVPDCPLARWSKAGAFEMLGKVDEAIGLYLQIFRGGHKQLSHPDTDANECWEGPDWTAGLIADCQFKLAGCLAKTGDRDAAVEAYQDFLSLTDLETKGLYSREDALKKLKKLVPTKEVRREAAVKVMARVLASA
jgi:tetratricopeptide (TPR) repeat protein